MITTEQLKNIFLLTHQGTIDIYQPILSEMLPKYHIDTLERVRCFLAQVGEESNGLTATAEGASGKEYEDREDLGNTHPGDGAKFKGRGLIQVTGRVNYAACSKFLFGDNRLLDQPVLLELPRHAVESACWYWNTHNLSAVADHDDTWSFTAHHPAGTWNKFQWITIMINGGLNGYDQRLKFYTRARQVITSLPQKQ